MLFRSTGLGKTELVVKVRGLRRQGDYLIMDADTTEPVRWHIRGAINIRDIGTILKGFLKLSTLTWLLCPTNWRKEPQHPGDY